MLSKDLHEISSEASEICKFYAGKTIFITGAGGFLGTVLLETLLRCCRDVAKIYILLRPKKGVQPEDRKNLIFQKDIFINLKETCPDVLNKVVAVSGDTSQNNLGMIENDFNNLAREVSVVFHIAAAISFSKPLSFIVRQNVIATNNIIEFCRKSEKLECLVYTSSVYSCSNQKDVIEEKIYDLPYPAEEVVKFGRYNDEDEMMRLYNMCKPQFPNFYTFSKCVSENLLKEKAQDLPVCIIRPSIIFCSLQGPLPGYVEDGSSFVDLGVAVGIGFTRVVRLDSDVKNEIIPVDVVANCHIVAASHQVLNSLPSPSVYNCVYGDQTAIRWGDYISKLTRMLRENPLPRSYVYPMCIVCKDALPYNLLSLLLHYIPAAVIDLFLWISGSKLRLLKNYEFYEKALSKVHYFVSHNWNMHNKNFQSLSKGFNALEEEMFNMDLKDFNLDRIIQTLPTGAAPYRIDGKPYEKKFKQKILRYCVTFLLVSFYLGSMASLLYFLFFTIF